MIKRKFTRATINWTVKEVVRMHKEGRLNFDHAAQRKLVWTPAQKSLLIDTILQNYEVPLIFAAKGAGTDVFDILDGKQRLNAIIDFVNGNFALSDLSDECAEFDGLTFEQLDEDERDQILSYPLFIRYFDGMDPGEAQDCFFRINNGKSLTKYEQNRAKAKSLPIVTELTSHPLFDKEISGRSYTGYKKEEAIYRIFMVLTSDATAVDLEGKALSAFIRDHEITADEAAKVKAMLDYYYRIIELIKASINKENEKTLTRIYKRLFIPTHIFSILPLIDRAEREHRSALQLKNWLIEFFSGKKKASVSETYNNFASSGANKASAVEHRAKEIAKHYEDFMSEPTLIAAAL